MPSTPVEIVLQGLENVKPGGKGWTALCPAHEDRQNSLSIREGDDGRALLKCFAGCKTEDVVGALGLAMGDLFPEKQTMNNRKAMICATYDYQDERGDLRYQVVRYQPKAFRQRRPDGAGGWIWNLKGVDRVLYRLPELLAADPNASVFVVEGEKDADRLSKAGLLATTTPGGAGKWRDEYSRSLAGRGVVLIPDNDEPGRRHVEQVAHSVHSVARSVKVIVLTQTDPDRVTKDVCDWLDAGHGIEELWALAHAAELWQPGVSEPKAAADATLSFTDVLQATGLEGLGEKATLDEIKAALEKLREQLKDADPLMRAVLREGAIRTLDRAGLRSPAGLVDAALLVKGRDQQQDLQGRQLTLSEPELWSDPVDGALLLNEIFATFTRYVVLPPGAAVALTLWTVFAHTHDAAVVSPLIGLKSATKRSGKTTSLTVLRGLVPRPLMASNVTAAVLFRTIEERRPTFLVDEADSFLADSDELRGLLNSGHTRSGAVVIRSIGDQHEPRLFSTYCPKAIAIIGNLPATLEDRAIVIPMRRKAGHERVRRLRLDRIDEELEPLRRKAARWARDHLEALRRADPEVPDLLHDRAADNWRPLLAISGLCGGCWPEDARWAALTLSGAAEEGDTAPNLLLLADLKQIFSEKRSERLSSEEIVRELGGREDRPWPEWKKGKPISATQLARLLKPFGVRPKQVWFIGKNVRGYERADLEDAFARYVPSTEPPEPPSEVLGPLEPAQDKPSDEIPKMIDGDTPSTSENNLSNWKQSDLAGLAVRAPPIWD